MIREECKKAVEHLITSVTMHELNEYGQMPSTDDILNTEFMGYCYDEGFRPLHDTWDSGSSSRNYEIHKLILRIIQIVVNFEWSDSDDK